MDINKKEILAQYKEREVIGGVYAIKNIQNGKLLLESATDLQGSKNRFEFSLKTGSCVSMKLRNDWKNGTFVFEVMEEIKKGETQTDAEFKSDVDALKEMWAEKFSAQELY